MQLGCVIVVPGLQINTELCLLQGIADEMKGKVSVVKIDTDKYPKIASRYGIKVLSIGSCPA